MDKNPRYASYAEELEKTLQVMMGQYNGGVSPSAVILAFYDWFLHFLINPSKHSELAELAQENFWTLFRESLAELSGDKQSCCNKSTLVKDKRFKDCSWAEFPFNYINQSFLMTQNWWDHATKDIRGCNTHHEDVVNFLMRQYLDMMSPSNSPLTNPEVIKATFEQNGENFLRGFENLVEDMRRMQKGEAPVGAEKFIVGKNMATTKGKVILKNNLIELIQYQPTTKNVYAEPILITPAWIMKYYILDLTSKQSLVKYLLDKGHTVFIISWKNPGKEDANLGLDDYLNLGILSSLEAIRHINGDVPIHLVGYCLGGTLSAIAAAYLAKNNDQHLASLTLLAAQTDFNDPGELGLFIDESQIAFLESMMKANGYLDTHQLAGAFQMLRSNDLIWSRMVHDYMLGLRRPLIALMAWNADATRLPYKMHSEYLRKLFLHNQLTEGNFVINDKTLALQDIQLPIFTVATEKDHVSPWQSVFKINLNTVNDVTFTLTTGGHNAGIVNVPGKKSKKSYRSSTLSSEHRYVNPDKWYQSVEAKAGSWWPEWEKWLSKYSSAKNAPPPMGNKKAGYAVIYDAPGKYVFMK